MYAEDFVYDGISLSSLGYVICNFGGSQDLETVSAGSVITFNTVSRHRGKKYSLTGTRYDQCIEATFQICKDPCSSDDLTISDNEYRSLMRWLNRNQFLQFNLVYDDNRDTCYYDASFNINKVLMNDKLYGLELSMYTNRPFGYGATETFTKTVIANETFNIDCISDETGYIYPNVTFTTSQAGDLTITNNTTGSVMAIKNCVNAETITVNGDAMTIATDKNSHHYFYNDFNYEFFNLRYEYPDLRNNNIKVSLSGVITISYKPIIKNSPE